MIHMLEIRDKEVFHMLEILKMCITNGTNIFENHYPRTFNYDTIICAV